MLSREKRLTKSRDFEAVYRKGRRISSASFNLSYRRNRLVASRVGIVVGKKFSGKAILRNKAKRVYREAARSIYPQILPGYDLVIFLKKNGSQKITLEGAIRELEDTFKKEGIIK